MRIRAEYEHGSVFVNGNEVYFRDYQADVPDHVGRYLLSRGNYTIGLHNHTSLGSAKNLLFVRGAGLGDVLLCVPIIRYIKKYVNTNVNIDWLCGTGEFVPVLNGCKWIRRVYDDKNLPPDVSHNYNYIISIDSAEFKTNDSYTMHRIDVFARRVPELKGVTIEDKHLEYTVTPEEEQWFQNQIIAGPYVVMVTTTTCFNRVLTEKQNRDIADAIVKMGYNIVMVEKNHVNSLHPKAINLTAKLNLRQVGAILKHATALITPDTGILHMASAMDVPTLAYFGAIDPKLRVTSSKTKTIYKVMPCFPCNGYICHHGRPLCLHDLSLEQILQTFRAVIGKVK